jgi:hypothetical protein
MTGLQRCVADIVGTTFRPCISGAGTAATCLELRRLNNRVILHPLDQDGARLSIPSGTSLEDLRYLPGAQFTRVIATRKRS